MLNRILLCISFVCALTMHSYSQSSRDMTPVACKDMSQEQIRDGIIDYLTNVLNAEIGYASNTLVIAYTEETTRYCTHVTYTVKFVLSENEYRYAAYYAIPLKDVNEACKNDIHKRIDFYNKKLKYIFLFQDSKAP